MVATKQDGAVYFANMGRARIKTTEVNQLIGVLKKIEISVTWEFAPLRGMNSILRQGIVKYNTEVDVSIQWGLFEIDPTKDVLAMSLRPVDATLATGAGIAVGAGLAAPETPIIPGSPTALELAAAAGKGIQDTNKVFLFDVDAYITDAATAGTPNYVTYTVSKCYMEKVPLMTGNENEWILRDISCKGRNVYIDPISTEKPDPLEWEPLSYDG